MAEMKFGLKSIMTESRFEIIVFKVAKQEYQVTISEISPYCNDDLHHHEVNTFKRLKDATEEQDKAFMYMSDNGFKKVKKRFSDIS